MSSNTSVHAQPCSSLGRWKQDSLCSPAAPMGNYKTRLDLGICVLCELRDISNAKVKAFHHVVRYEVGGQQAQSSFHVLSQDQQDLSADHHWQVR